MSAWTHQGLSVTPIESTRRRVSGGTAIDIVIHDKRTTVTRATVNADNLVRQCHHSLCGNHHHSGRCQGNCPEQMVGAS